ncbi:hypothetical protein DFH07DRAFT_249461 [Mycena maculata]|uniref:Uncharacterized protein n=1 Tax=Mycena maculata TaxID=230809 RepID=A0AAD7HQH9_9AGAR|nr:hypothetical protein DFH07DRAFT_249461 [Mycena maculata]
MLGPRSIRVDSRSTPIPSLQHQRSTKLLISRFESLSVPTSPAKAPLCPPKQAVDSKKSPIRQSFRSLLAVFKKGSGLRVGKSKLVQNLPPNATLSADDPFTVSTKSFPGPRLAGSLFYLVRSPATPQVPPPVWTFCSAVLEGDVVHLTWPTTPSTHSVLLKHCTDVRSLLSSQLDPEEKALLPGDVKDLKVFEILFEGRGPEKFATTSVRERARWVSAIWDVILPNTNSTSTSKEDTKMVDPGTANPDSFGQSRPSSICLDRALPPVPEQVSSPILPVHSLSPRMAVSPSIYTPTRPESRASSTCSRPRSPSMAQLGHLSVVRQRLAQIEGIHQFHSAPNSPSHLYRNSSSLRTKSLCVQTMFQAEATTPASPTSILDSYGVIYPAANRGVSPSVDTVQDEHVNCPPSHSVGIRHDVPSAHAPSPNVQDPLLADMHQMITAVAQGTEETKNTVNTMRNILDDQPARSSDPAFASVMQALEDIHRRLRSELPDIVELLVEIQAGVERKEVPTNSGTQAPFNTPTICDVDKLNQILEILQEDGVQRSMQTHQQTDSVRYLNELNSWLEAFVRGGTAQIQAVAAGVEKLTKELGCSDEQKNPSGSSGNIVADIRQIISDGQAREQSAAALQLSVNNLTALIGSESRNSFSTQSITSLMDRQRQDQEGLLRALTAELSNEIRGERLRFVDAMKEATAINVQMHVEQLKAELAREVRADLFEFYSKQKPHAASHLKPMYAQHSRMAPPRSLPNPRYAVYP